MPISKLGRPITGPELATLLEILVTAANEGSLAEVNCMFAELEAHAYNMCIIVWGHCVLTRFPGDGRCS